MHLIFKCRIAQAYSRHQLASSLRENLILLRQHLSLYLSSGEAGIGMSKSVLAEKRRYVFLCEPHLVVYINVTIKLLYA